MREWERDRVGEGGREDGRREKDRVGVERERERERKWKGTERQNGRSEGER